MGRLRCGLIAAFYGPVVCWCSLAAAQEELAPALPQDALINDLFVKQNEAKQNEAQVWVKNALELFLARVNSELRFIGRACELTPEQQVALNEAGLDVFEKFAKVLQAPVANRRLAVVDGQVVVIHAQGTAQTFVPDGILRGQLDAAVRKALPEELSAKLQAERERIGRKAHEANLLATLAAIDEAMLLSPEGRERLGAYLDANWSPAWDQIVSGSQWPAATATPLQTAKARGLGGIFDLLDADLEPFLTAPQMAAWRGMRNLPVNVAGMGLAGGLRPGAAILRGQVNGRVVFAQGANARAGAAPVRIPGNPPVERRPVIPARVSKLVEPAGVSTFEPPRELALYLNVLVAGVAAAVKLSESQRETLLLAGQLDIKRYQDERAKALEELPQQARAAGARVRIVTRTEPLTASNPYAYAQSRYRKALSSRLSEDQLRRLAAACGARRERAREAMVQSLVRELNESALLTSKQWDAVAEAVRQSLPPMTDGVTEARLHDELLFCLACLGTEGLRPLFGEDQWPAAERKLAELRQSADQAQRLRPVQ